MYVHVINDFIGVEITKDFMSKIPKAATVTPAGVLTSITRD